MDTPSASKDKADNLWLGVKSRRPEPVALFNMGVVLGQRKRHVLLFAAGSAILIGEVAR